MNIMNFRTNVNDIKIVVVLLYAMHLPLKYNLVSIDWRRAFPY